MAFENNILGNNGDIDLSIFADVAFSGDFNDLINVPSIFTPGLQEVTDVNTTTTNSITVGGLTAGNLFTDGYTFGISDNFDNNYNFLYSPYVGLTLDDFSGNQSILMSSGLQLNLGFLQYTNNIIALWDLPSNSGTIALTSDIPSLSGYLTSSDAASTYFPIPTGNMSQYIRGDGSLATFPSYSAPGLNDVTSVSGISFGTIRLKNTIINNEVQIDWNGFGFRNGINGTAFQSITPFTQLATIYVPNTPGVLALISDIPTTATEIGALAIDGSNANTDVDISAYSLKAKRVFIGNAGAQMEVKGDNVTEPRTAQWQNRDYNAIADVQDIIDYLATFKTTEFLDFTSSGQAQLDSKQPLLGFTPENVVNKSDSYTTSSSTTFASTKALVDGLNTKQPLLYYIPYKFVQTSQTAHTGTTAKTIVATATINGGTFPTMESLKFLFGVNKPASTGAYTLRCDINTTNTLSGSATVATFTGSATAQVAVMTRVFSLLSGSLYGYPFTTSQLSDSAALLAGTLGSTTYNTTNTLYMFWTIQLVNSADSVTPNLTTLTN